MSETEVNSLLNDFDNLLKVNEIGKVDDEKWLKKLQEKWSLHPKLTLSLQEGYCKWFCDNSSRFTGITELQTTLNNDESYTGFTDNYLKYNFTNVFSTQMNVAFCHIILGTEEKCREALEVAERSLDNFREVLLYQEPSAIQLKDAEHLEGAEFTLESLKLLSKLQFEDEESFNTAIEKMKQYDELHAKSKAFLLIMKAKFYGDCFRSCNEKEIRDQEPKFILKAIEIDSHWEWHIEYFQYLRQTRRDTDNQAIPSLKEKKNVETAYKANPQHPLCIIRSCQFLAEYTKSTRYSPNEGFPLRFGNRSFQHVDEVVTFLKERAEEFLENYLEFSKWLNQFARFFSSDLPRNCRNLELAKKCLLKALSGSPNSSSINHRMGVFLIQGKQFSESEQYLLKAVETDIRNGVAVTDCLKVLFRNISDNTHRIKGVLNKIVPAYTKIISSPQFGNILFLKGFFHFKIDEIEEAVSTWFKWISYIKTAGINSKWKLSFGDLGEMHYYSGWPVVDVEELISIREVVHRYQGREGFDKELFPLILESINKAINVLLGHQGTMRPA